MKTSGCVVRGGIIQSVYILFPALLDDGLWTNSLHWSLLSTFWSSSAKSAWSSKFDVDIFLLYLWSFSRSIWTFWTVFPPGFYWLCLGQKDRWGHQVTVLNFKLSRSDVVLSSKERIIFIKKCWTKIPLLMKKSLEKIRYNLHQPNNLFHGERGKKGLSFGVSKRSNIVCHVSCSCWVQIP